MSARTKKKDQEISTLGSLVAVQLILTAQLQNTYENPFIVILTLIFGMRVFLKFIRFMLVHTARHSHHFFLVFSKFCCRHRHTCLFVRTRCAHRIKQPNRVR
jgi:hypothetical protein